MRYLSFTSPYKALMNGQSALELDQEAQLRNKLYWSFVLYLHMHRHQLIYKSFVKAVSDNKGGLVLESHK